MPRNFQKPAVTREHTGDAQFDRVQADIRELARNLRNSPFFVGRLKSVRFTAATRKIVGHGIGRPAAFMVVRNSYVAGTFPSIAEDASQAGLDVNREIAIVCSTDCTLDLWFYPRSSLTAV